VPTPASQTDRLNTALAGRYRVEHSGQMLYCRSPAGLMTVPVTTGARFTIGERRIVPAGETFDDGTHAGYDVAPDGQLLMLRSTGADVSAVLVHNWGRVLREKLGLVKK